MTEISEKIVQTFKSSQNEERNNNRYPTLRRSVETNNFEGQAHRVDIDEYLEEVKLIKNELDKKLTEDDFERYFSLNKNSLKEIQEYLEQKVDESDLQEILETKAGNFLNITI